MKVSDPDFCAKKMNYDRQYGLIWDQNLDYPAVVKYTVNVVVKLHQGQHLRTVMDGVWHCLVSYCAAWHSRRIAAARGWSLRSHYEVQGYPVVRLIRIL